MRFIAALSLALVAACAPAGAQSLTPTHPFQNAPPFIFTPGGIPTDTNFTNVTSDTSCTQISLSPLTWGTGFVSAAATQQSVTVALYNSSSCSTPIFGPVALNAAADFNVLLPIKAYASGVWIQLSGAPTGTVYLYWL